MEPLSQSAAQLLGHVLDRPLSETATVRTLTDYANSTFLHLKIIGSFVRRTVDPQCTARDIDFHAEPLVPTSCESAGRQVELEFVRIHNISQSYLWIPRTLQQPFALISFSGAPVTKSEKFLGVELKISSVKGAVLTACDHLVIIIPQQGEPHYISLIPEYHPRILQEYIRKREDWLLHPEAIQETDWHRIAGRLVLGTRFIQTISASVKENYRSLPHHSFNEIITRRSTHTNPYKVLLFFNMVFLFETFGIFDSSMAEQFPLQGFFRDVRDDPFLLSLLQFMKGSYPACWQERYTTLCVLADYVSRMVFQLPPSSNFGTPATELHLVGQRYLYLRGGPFSEEEIMLVREIPTCELNRMFIALVRTSDFQGSLRVHAQASFLDHRLMPLFLHRIDLSALGMPDFVRLFRSALELANTDDDLALIPTSPHWNPELLLKAVLILLKEGPMFTKTTASLLSILARGDAKQRMQEKLELITTLVKTRSHIWEYAKPVLDLISKMPPPIRSKYLSGLSSELSHILYRMAKDISHPMKSKLEEIFFQGTGKSLKDFSLPLVLSIAMQNSSRECFLLLKERTKDPKEFFVLLENPSFRFQILSLLNELFRESSLRGMLHEWLLRTFCAAPGKLLLLDKLFYQYYFFPQTVIRASFRALAPLSPSFFGPSLFQFFQEADINTCTEILTVTLSACTDREFCERMVMDLKQKNPLEALRFLHSLFVDKTPLTREAHQLIEEIMERELSSPVKFDWALLYLDYFHFLNALEPFISLIKGDSECLIVQSHSWILLFNALMAASSEDGKKDLVQYSSQMSEVDVALIPVQEIVNFATAHEISYGGRFCAFALKKIKPHDQIQLILKLVETTPPLAVKVFGEIRKSGAKEFVFLVEGCFERHPDFIHSLPLFPLSEEERSASQKLVQREYLYFRQDLSHYRELYPEELGKLIERRVAEVNALPIHLHRLEIELLTLFFQHPELRTDALQDKVSDLLFHISDPTSLEKLQPLLIEFLPCMNVSEIISYCPVMAKLGISFMGQSYIKMFAEVIHTRSGESFISDLSGNPKQILALCTREEEKAFMIFMLVVFSRKVFRSEQEMLHYICSLHGRPENSKYKEFAVGIRKVIIEYSLNFWKCPPVEEDHTPVATFKNNLFLLISLVTTSCLAERLHIELFCRTVEIVDAYRQQKTEYIKFVQEFVRTLIDLEMVYAVRPDFSPLTREQFRDLTIPALQFYMKILRRLPHKAPSPLDTFFERHPEWYLLPHEEFLPLLAKETERSSIPDFMTVCRKIQLPSTEVLEPCLEEFFHKHCIGFSLGTLCTWHELALFRSFSPDLQSRPPLDALQRAVVVKNFEHIRRLGVQGRKVLLFRVMTALEEEEGKKKIVPILERFVSSFSMQDRALFGQALINCHLPLLPANMTAEALIDFLTPEGQVVADLVFIQNVHTSLPSDNPALRSLIAVILTCFSRIAPFRNRAELEQFFSSVEGNFQDSLPLLISPIYSFISSVYKKMLMPRDTDPVSYSTFSGVRERLLELMHFIWDKQKKCNHLTSTDYFLVVGFCSILKGTALQLPITSEMYQGVITNFHLALRELRFYYKIFLASPKDGETSALNHEIERHFLLVSHSFLQSLDYCLENLPSEKINFFHHKLRIAMQEDNAMTILKDMNPYDCDEGSTALITRYAKSKNIDLSLESPDQPHESLLLTRHKECYLSSLSSFSLGPLEKLLLELNIPCFILLSKVSKIILLQWSKAAFSLGGNNTSITAAWAVHSPKFSLEDIALCAGMLIDYGINCMASEWIRFNNPEEPWFSSGREKLAVQLSQNVGAAFVFCANHEQRSLLILLATLINPGISFSNSADLEACLSRIFEGDPTLHPADLHFFLLQALDDLFDSFTQYIPFPDTAHARAFQCLRPKIDLWITAFFKNPKILNPYPQYRFSLGVMQCFNRVLGLLSNNAILPNECYQKCNVIFNEILPFCLRSAEEASREIEPMLSSPFLAVQKRVLRFFKSVFAYLHGKDPTLRPSELESQFSAFLQQSDRTDLGIFTQIRTLLLQPKREIN